MLVPPRYAMPGAIALAAILALTSCDDDPTGPESDDGEVGFAIDGDTDGFSATGDLVFDVEGRPILDWAVAADPDSVGGIAVTAFQTTGEGSGDLFVLQLRPVRTGQFSPCGPDEECHGRLLRGWHTDYSGFDEWFEIVSGSAQIDEIGSRIRGTFAFTLRNEGGEGPETLVIESGVLDVPIDEGADGLLCSVPSVVGCFTEDD